MKKTFLIILTILLVGCAQEETGRLTGQISTDADCALQKINETCPTIHNNLSLGIYRPEQSSAFKKIEPAPNGSYSAEIPTGTYVVDFTEGQSYSANLPATVHIKKNERTSLNVTIR